MKKIVLLLMFLSFLSGCTKNSNNDHENVKPDVVLRAGEGLITGSGEFGQLGPKDSKILTVRITNNGTSPLQGPPVIDNPNFSIIYQSGCATILPTKRCDLKISFSAAGKPFALYNANLNLDSVFLALSAEVVVPNPPTASVSFSSSPVDFGTITNKQNSVKTITVKNIGTAVINQAVMAPPVSSGFSVLYDSCSNKNISPNKTCTLKISMNGTGPLGNLNADLNYGSVVSLIGQIVSSTGTTSLGSPDVKLLVDNAVATTYDFGTLSGTQFKQIVVTAKNLGTQASEVSMANLVLNTNFSILFNQCNKSLAPNSSCQIRLVFNAVSKDPGFYSDTLNFSGQNLLISGLIQSLQPQITVTLDVPPNTLMFTNQIYPPSTPGYMECNGYEETSNKQCQFTFTKGSNINIELQYNRDSVEPLNWVGCPEIVPGGPGQWFCQLSTATANFTLGMITQPVTITYQGLFTDWSNCDALVCSGSGEQSRELVGCEKIVNGENQGSVPMFRCEENPNELTVRSCPSPFGSIQSVITGGTSSLTCAEGDATGITTVSCSRGFNESGNSCTPTSISCNIDDSVLNGWSNVNVLEATGSRTGNTVSSCSVNCLSGFIKNNSTKTCDNGFEVGGPEFTINNQDYFVRTSKISNMKEFWWEGQLVGSSASSSLTVNNYRYDEYFNASVRPGLDTTNYQAYRLIKRTSLIGGTLAFDRSGSSSLNENSTAIKLGSFYNGHSNYSISLNNNEYRDGNNNTLQLYFIGNELYANSPNIAVNYNDSSSSKTYYVKITDLSNSQSWVMQVNVNNVPTLIYTNSSIAPLQQQPMFSVSGSQLELDIPNLPHSANNWYFVTVTYSITGNNIYEDFGALSLSLAYDDSSYNNPPSSGSSIYSDSGTIEKTFYYYDDGELDTEWNSSKKLLMTYTSEMDPFNADPSMVITIQNITIKLR